MIDDACVWRAGQNGIKDSASSTLSGDISMQPYIKRAGTDDSGCAAPPPR
jgi:hypothetical protein